MHCIWASMYVYVHVRVCACACMCLVCLLLFSIRLFFQSILFSLHSIQEFSSASITTILQTDDTARHLSLGALLLHFTIEYLCCSSLSLCFSRTLLCLRILVILHPPPAPDSSTHEDETIVSPPQGQEWSRCVCVYQIFWVKRRSPF